ncbi:folylpolyglutamate synthase, mitochondrial [Eupeodes corollae]|uniref:folylpolyglutamate synthase, mitochondrial n=1 Tax=Eupeodes corollae TaxID=290404 RepID=UPI0024915F3A|nr:folylpolyglutamate synthase, mitochondrial [Eupeodes corollae]XP_055914845.1 folylpolyglutamate synthase, mitochondrial [Eupeodes corollae]
MFMQFISRSVRSSRLTLDMLRKNSISNGTAIPPGKASFKGTEATDTEEYEMAIQKLNTLQSNAASIRESITNKKMLTNLNDTIKYLNRSGLSLEELDKLSVIHVSGTKGKGSTCALSESILREYGVRTGFFSSPHLVSVTERIRINGEAISKKKFTQYFWKIFNRLEKHKDTDNDLPAYFKFLTILCFHVFLEEKVDVAILEVGIGGEYDSTNVVRNTSIAGITSLGLEHTNILGDTIEEITIQKAGIIKDFSNLYTNVKQQVCLDILRNKANQKNAKIIQVPEITEYHWPKGVTAESLNKIVQLNGSLAIQLAYNWLKKSGTQNLNGLSAEIKSDDIILSISDRVIKAFDNCLWPGRLQIMNFYNLRIHLDGAHTLESMEICGDWFRSVTKKSYKNPKILIFNATGERDSMAMLTILSNRANFNDAFFVPNIPFTLNAVGDIHSVYGHTDQIRKAESHASNWRKLTESDGIHRGGEGRVFGTILEAFLQLQKKFENTQVDVLVTGSIHLLGATILALEEFEKQIIENKIEAEK